MTQDKNNNQKSSSPNGAVVASTSNNGSASPPEATTAKQSSVGASQNNGGGSAANGSTNASNGAGANTSGTTAGAKDRSRDLSTAKTAQSTPQNTNPNANRTIGHYVVGRSLGQGTFGKVRLGTHLITGEKVAIKILEKDKIKDQSDVERVTREIHILKIVRHPNVIQLYEIIETSRQLFLIMEYASGGELFDYIVKRKRLQEDEACRFFQQIVSGVEYIHKVRICHRDLKPENLLLDDQNNIKIVDFGLSNMYNDGDTLKTACGSPCYAAPEMIAGKRYHGLNSDIWSCGIILYAMTCGYLPFEDPNTSKLYKKILNCDYLIPGFISKASKELIKKVLNTDPVKRFTITDIRTHEWYSQVKPVEMEGIIVGKDRIPVIEEFLSKIQDCFNTSGISPNCDLTQTVTYIQNNKHNQITSTYYLLLKKKQRETGRDSFFEQVMRDKKRNLYSTSNLNNITLNSLQKIQTPGKIMMHSTMGSGFKVNQVSKSEARPLQTQEGFGSKLNPATKKYLEQMNKIQKKRTESTAQARLADMMSNFKNNNLDKHAMTNSPLADTLIHQNNQTNIRGAQSQSPTQRINGMLGAQKPNQTFFMADRMRKQGGSNATGNRPLSIDEMNTTHHGVLLQSTNDSRIHEMLPHVNGQVNQKQQMFNQTRVGGFGNSQTSNKGAQNQTQMRNTMYNGNFMKNVRQSNAGQQNVNNFQTQQHQGGQPFEQMQHNIAQTSDRDGASSFGINSSGVGSNRIGTTNGVVQNNQAHLFNLVNQRKTPNGSQNPQQQMMMTTQQFFNSTQNNQPMLQSMNSTGQNSNQGNTQINKTIAQAKLRKQRANRGASNPIQQQHENSMSINGNADYQNMNATVYINHNRKRSIQGGPGGNFANVNAMNATMNVGNFTGNGDSNATSGNHTAISGGRKPTADSTAYTLYKPNKQARGKFSNGGGSIAGTVDGSFEAGYHQQNNSIVLMDKQNQMNQSNFSTGPNTTASRFYNPKQQQQQHQSPQNANMNDTQTRFMQNIQNNRPKVVGSMNNAQANGQNGVFQNNFILSKGSPNAGMLKTFYNSKQSAQMGNIANAVQNGGQMQGNIYSHAHYQTNNSNNSTKRAIQGMKMHI